ncbi:MAG: hypothetical protein QOK37_3716 [Thermoanaerobaculia bacterium]|jgi:hypothetical protein|nr:hypothetical protein [Thermoanaerobaculia bacterium]
MRTLLGILLTLWTSAVLGQTSDFYFYPNYGPLEGGTEIHIVANGFLRFTAPQVFFGDVPATRVTLDSANMITAVTPAHAIGLVSVTVRDNGANLTSLEQLAFAPVLEEILIPVALPPTGASYGTRWVSEISVYNDSDDSVPIDREICLAIGWFYDCSQSARRVPPHASMVIEPREHSTTMLLHPPADRAAKLHFNVRLREASRDPDGPGTEIPVVRGHELQQTHVWLPSIPTSARFRTTLRAYTRAGAITILVRDDASGELLYTREIVRPPLPTDGDPFGTETLSDVLGPAAVRARTKVRIEVEAHGMPLWALLTLTDNETQRVQIFTPQ